MKKPLFAILILLSTNLCCQSCQGPPTADAQVAGTNDHIKGFAEPISFSLKISKIKSLQDWDEFSINFEKDGEMVNGILAKHPKNTLNYFEQNKNMISFERNYQSKMPIKDIKIDHIPYKK